jgi:hypothetical protein
MDRVVVERLDGGLIHGLHIAGVAALSTLKITNGAPPIMGDAPRWDSEAPKPAAALEGRGEDDDRLDPK